MQENTKEKRILKNSGFAFGFLKEKPGLVKAVPLVVTGGMFAYMIKLLHEPGKKLQKLGTACTLTGAAGNTAQRLIKGYVVDDIPVKRKNGTTFFCNIYDIAIWTGTALMLIGSISGNKKEKGNKIWLSK